MMPIGKASQVPAAARAPVAAQPIDDNASAKVAMRDEVWRRRKWLRLAWVRNQSWMAVAEAVATTMPTAETRRRRARRTASADDEREEHEGDDAHHGLDLRAQDVAGGDRRRGDEVGRVLAGDGEPGEAAGELSGRHDQHRRQQPSSVPAPPEKLRHSSSAGGSR